MIENKLYAHCVELDNSLKGRLGGCPPKTIENQLPKDYYFYATIRHPEKEKMMLSILLHKDPYILIENNIYPDLKIKIIEHTFSESGENINKAHPDLPHAYSITEYGNSYTPKDSRDCPLVQVSKEPELIQHIHYYHEPLENNNYAFFLQIDEHGYSQDHLGEYPFNFGSLYLYKHNKTEEVIAGYWQCS